MIAKFGFAAGYHLPGLDPDTVGERLSTLRADLGSGFTKAAVVADAKDNPEPYGDYFVWDDAKAGAKYREEQAGYLIRAVVVHRDEEDKPPVRAFVSVVERESEKDRYLPLVTAMSDEDYRDQMLSDALRYFISGRRRYAEYQGLARIFAAIDATVAEREQPVELPKAA
jgi:hypothetical protein